mmetsp:Transcript_101996/g.263640  ORF Transcript_101996/g.263640 Transcript_101996/m.263640 type:complete len:351 (-) Transcript_101996:145-1197(-)
MNAGGVDGVALAHKVAQLEADLARQSSEHAVSVQRFQGELIDLQRLVEELEQQSKSLEVIGRSSSAEHYVRRVEWTISGFAEKRTKLAKGESIWSPKFKAAGMDGMQLEFFPNGRERTTYDGFCSLFLWCPNGTKIKYQLWVGTFLRAPDEDEYTGLIGHGHSNFCPVDPEVDRSADSVRVGVDLLEVRRTDDVIEGQGLRLISKSLESMVAREATVVQNKAVNKVCWKIQNISRHLKHYPRGFSMCSQLFTAAGIRDILLDFYPNGSSNTTKDGYCAFYIRCPEGVSMIVTLFVGKVRKGPIKTTFDNLTGKGLPDFCPLQEEINAEDDSLEVGIELQNNLNRTLTITS